MMTYSRAGVNDNFRAMMAFQVERAREHFRKGRQLMPLLTPRSRVCPEMLHATYSRLLDRIEAAGYNVFGRRVSLSAREKLALMARLWANGLAARAAGKVVVVGGGLAGMAAACDLADRGHPVTLMEKRPFLGGRAFSFPEPETGREIDNGQHVFLGCCTAYVDFLRRLGVLHNTHVPAAPGRPHTRRRKAGDAPQRQPARALPPRALAAPLPAPVLGREAARPVRRPPHLRRRPAGERAG